jgi:uncharacterized membrane protein (DUF4010 family)
MVLDEILLALALGALVGLEREGVPDRKYAGVRTLSLFCAAGPVAVILAGKALMGTVLPVGIYIVLGAVFSLLVVYMRVRSDQDDLGLTTSSTVFLMGLVGVLVGYEQHFEAVAVTLVTVLLLSEKDMFTKYTALLSSEELSDAVKLGILALVLYPVLPSGAVDPYGVLFLRKALLFVIFILLVQFVAYVSLRWLQSSISFIASAGLGGVVSSLAVVTALSDYYRDGSIREAAYAGGVIAVVGAVIRNGFIAVTLAPELLTHLLVPFAAAAMAGTVFVAWYYRQTTGEIDIDIGSESPFSFTAAFKFGIFFLGILMMAEVAQQYFSALGIYATAFIAAIGSSTAVVASAVTLLQSGTITVSEAAFMVVIGGLSSMSSKLVYTELGGTRGLTKHLLIPYLLMGLALLTVLL